MGALLKKILDIVLHGALKRLLIGAGLGLASTAILLTVINYYVDKLIQHLNSFGAVGQFGQGALALLGIAGVDIAISIVIGAYIVRFTIKKTQVFLMKSER